MGLSLEALPPPLKSYARARLDRAGVTWPAADDFACETRFLVQAAMTRDEALALRLLTESGGTLAGFAKAIAMPSPLLFTIYKRWQNESEPYPIRLLRRDDALEGAGRPAAEVAPAAVKSRGWYDSRLLLGAIGFGGVLLAAAAGAWLYMGRAPAPVAPREVPVKVVSGSPQWIIENTQALHYGVDVSVALRRLKEAGVNELRCQEVKTGWECRTSDGRNARSIAAPDQQQPPSGH